MRVSPEQLIPGGIKPSDHVFVRIHDDTCSRCRKPIPVREVPLILWIGQNGERMYRFCESCQGVPAIERAARRWGIDPSGH